jgi:hypothetical protein
MRVIRIGNTVIAKDPQKNTFTIKNDMSPQLMQSIGDKAAAPFEAVAVLTVRQYLARCQHATELYVALRLVHDLGRQMQALLSVGRGIACFSADDVLVITHRDSDAFAHSDDGALSDAQQDPQFLFLNDRLVFEVDDSDGALLIDRALHAADAFLPPELVDQAKDKDKDKDKVQAKVHFKAAYYSAAQLVIHFLLNVDVSPDTDLNECLQPIKGTKLYWFLLRCLNRAPSERKYIYI